MFFKKKNKENIKKRKLINLYNKLFAEMFSENQEKDRKKVYVDFSENRIDIGIEIEGEINEKYEEPITKIFTEWTPSVDKKLNLVIVTCNGVILEYFEDVENIDVEYVSKLVEKIIEKYSEILENIV